MQKNTRTILAGVLALIVISALVLFADPTCRVEKDSWTARGSSLSGIIEDGQKVKAQSGYYQCHTPKQGEVVIYEMPGREEPLMKIVKAAPGDSFSVRKTEEGNRIFVNNQMLVNSQGQPYELSENRLEFLQGYEKLYNGKVPEGHVFILGNVPDGSIDSILFGFAPISRLVARVEP